MAPPPLTRTSASVSTRTKFQVRDAMIALIAERGPMSVMEIASAIGETNRRVAGCGNHRTFARTAGGMLTIRDVST
jgi:hypothetical protein